MAIHRFWARLSQGRPWRGCGKPYSGNFQTSKNRPYLQSGVFSFLMAVGLMGVCGVMIFVFPGKADSTSSLEPDEFSPRQGAMDLQLISRGMADAVSDSAEGKSVLSVPSGSTVSQDGRFLVFVSEAYNLIENQINSRNGSIYYFGTDVYLYDRLTGTNILVSHAGSLWNITGNNSSYSPAISADGNFVVFSSLATDLVFGQTYQDGSQGPRENVFLFDRENGVTTLVNHLPGLPATADGKNSRRPTLSADGRFVVYEAGSIYVYDRITDTTKLVSHRWNSFDTPATGSCRTPTISMDGKMIAFVSNGMDFVADQKTHPREENVFLYDQETGYIDFVSHPRSKPDERFVRDSSAPILNADGRYLLFSSSASDLIPDQNDHNNGSAEDNEGRGSDVFLYEQETGRMLLVSHQSLSLTDTASGESFGTGISADGRYVVFSSYAADLIDGQLDPARGDRPENEDIFLFDRETQMTILVSRNSYSSLFTGDARSYNPVISADGTSVAFASLATNLVPGQYDPGLGGRKCNLFLFHRLDESVTLISHSASSPTEVAQNFATLNLDQFSLALSTTGEFVYYATLAFNLETSLNDLNRNWDLYVFSQLGQTNHLVTFRAVNEAGATADGSSFTGGGYWGDGSSSAISESGDVLVFTSTANNLVPGQIDVNRGLTDREDIFLFDRASHTTHLISHKPGFPGMTGARRSLLPALSGNGRYVVYLSEASDLVTGLQDGNGAFWDVFLYDRTTQTTDLVSHAFDSLIDTGNSDKGIGALYQAPSISEDGRYIVFSSTANNLVDGFKNPNRGYEVFLYDRETKALRLVSHLNGDPLQAGLGNAIDAAISADGRFITFASRSLGLIKGQPPGVSATANLYVYDRVKDITRLVSHIGDSAQTGGNNDSRLPSMSADGRYITYISQATNLIAWQIDKNKKTLDGYDVFVYDQETRTNQLVSHTEASVIITGDGDSHAPMISVDGRYIAYRSLASNLSKNQIDKRSHSYDIFLYDRKTGQNILISRSYGTKNTAGNHESFGIALSADGKRLVFQSVATDLVANQPQISQRSDSNIFLFDVETKTTSLITYPRIPPVQPTNYGASWAAISPMGDFLVFSSAHTDLVRNDFNRTNDLFLAPLPLNPR